jgi:uncharacterized membrane protein
MIGLDAIGLAAAALPATVALHHALDRHGARRWRNAAFWAAFATTLGAGPWLPDLANGCLVLAMVALATLGLRPGAVTSSDETTRAAGARRWGARLFLPALALPLVTLGGTLGLPDGRIAGIALIEPKQVTLAALVAGAAVALGLACCSRARRAAPRRPKRAAWPMASAGR